MNRNRKTFGRRPAAVLLAALMSLSFPVSGLAAAAPMTGTEAMDTEPVSEELTYGPAAAEALGLTAPVEEEIPKELLEDNVLEYREIAARIKGYNPTYLNAKTSVYDGYLNLDAARDLAEEASELMEDAMDLRSSDMSAEERAEYEATKDAAQTLRKQAQKMTNEELPSAGERTLRSASNGMVQAVQGLMIQYQTLEAQAAVADKNVELSQMTLESKQRMAELGMASSEEVLAAMQSLQQAQSSAGQLHSGLSTLCQNILMLTGWEADAQISFAPIGEPDLNRIAEMNPETDIREAIGANTNLYSLRSSSAQGAANRTVKQRNVELTEQNVAIQVTNLYENVISKKQAYEGAAASFEAAAQTMASADRMYAMGMMGKMEYTGAQLSYLNAKAGYTGASLELFKAMEDYDWAVRGLLPTSGG